MKIFNWIILAILVFLAVSSGVTKIMLMEQDVEFFSTYGFTNPLLIAYGTAQVIGGLLLIPPKTRVLGAIIVAITFVISLVMLIMANSWLFTVVTIISLLLLGMVIRERLMTARKSNV
ncbi:MAG: hypothetical protein DHS20C09_21090 [marine bacterium B5-7]|nr:MAG: hypothetical protein DHS20C09_21090 [marine bacterium B5-7]